MVMTKVVDLACAWVGWRDAQKAVKRADLTENWMAVEWGRSSEECLEIHLAESTGFAMAERWGDSKVDCWGDLMAALKAIQWDFLKVVTMVKRTAVNWASLMVDCWACGKAVHSVATTAKK